MPRFCTQCGAKNADDARFCEQCGAPLRPSGVQPAPPAAPVQAAPQPAPASRSRRAALWALGGMSVLLLAAAALAWYVFTRGDTPSFAELQAAANSWLQDHQAALLRDNACVRNFNYAANPVFVNGFDQNTQQWLDALVKAGVYAAPVKMQNGFLQQLKYAHGPQAARYIRDGALCVADGLRIQGVQPLRPGENAAGSLPAGVKLPEGWALARVELVWSGQPAWAQQPPVSTQFPRLSAPLAQTILLHKTAQGWVLPSEAEEIAMRAQLAMRDAGGALGQSMQQWGQQLSEAGQSLREQAAAPRAQSAQSGGFFDWLKDLLGFGDPVRSMPAQFYGDVQNGRFDAAYALLGPDLQILGPDKMRVALRQAQAQIQAKGGVDKIKVIDVIDQGDVKLVRFDVRYGDGSQQTETLRVGKIGDQWRIVSRGGL
ncbi:MAG: zinc ribbon domain-containing protein [Thiomonas sp.]